MRRAWDVSCAPRWENKQLILESKDRCFWITSSSPGGMSPEENKIDNLLFLDIFKINVQFCWKLGIVLAIGALKTQQMIKQSNYFVIITNKYLQRKNHKVIITQS